jgi:hypothetical protein
VRNEAVGAAGVVRDISEAFASNAIYALINRVVRMKAWPRKTSVARLSGSSSRVVNPAVKQAALS